jgi:hypothetical protein
MVVPFSLVGEIYTDLFELPRNLVTEMPRQQQRSPTATLRHAAKGNIAIVTALAVIVIMMHAT